MTCIKIFINFGMSNFEGYMKLFPNCFRAILLLSLFITTSLYAEIEPNNIYQQANLIGLNSSDSGALNEATQTQPADYDDWWKVTLSSNGSLVISTTSSSNLDIDLYIYDTNGSNIIASSTKYGTNESVQHLGLKAGTYFIRVFRASGTGTYSIVTKYSAASYSNDTEPNDTYQTAQVLNLNSQTTGHIRYYSNSSTDYDDFWKFTIPFDGSFTVTTQSDSADIDLYIYDINGSNIIKSSTTYGLTETVQYTNLMPGTYYVRVFGVSKQSGYKITTVYTQTSINNITTNDAEKNDEHTTAVNWITFNAAGSVTNYGHLGYYSNSYTDYDDYWAITSTSDGKIDIKTESNSTLDIDLYLYDINGNAIIKSATTYGVNENLVFENLDAGKYFVRAFRASGYGSYKITAVFSAPLLSNDIEPNNESSQALKITSNNKMTGHLGYYSNNHTDSDDYYTIDLVSSWDSLYVRTDSDNSLDVDIYLINTNNSGMASAIAYGTKEILKFGKINAGKYFVRVSRANGQGSYAIMVSNHYIPTPLTDVNEQDIQLLPTAFSLSQNYPNPFNPATTIKYDLPENSNVELKVYDVLGNEVANLFTGYQNAGSYSVNFRADKLSSGVYFYRIDAGSFSQTKKFILMK